MGDKMNTIFEYGEESLDIIDYLVELLMDSDYSEISEKALEFLLQLREEIYDMLNGDGSVFVIIPDNNINVIEDIINDFRE